MLNVQIGSHKSGSYLATMNGLKLLEYLPLIKMLGEESEREGGYGGFGCSIAGTSLKEVDWLAARLLQPRCSM